PDASERPSSVIKSGIMRRRAYPELGRRINLPQQSAGFMPSEQNLIPRPAQGQAKSASRPFWPRSTRPIAAPFRSLPGEAAPSLSGPARRPDSDAVAAALRPRAALGQRPIAERISPLRVPAIIARNLGSARVRQMKQYFDANQDGFGYHNQCIG